MATELAWLVPVFLAVAFTYALAGFGGGSTYLAVLALAGWSAADMRVTALVCNIVVAGGATVRYARAGRLPWRRALPLVLVSVPAAYLGGRVDLPREQFLGLLGGVLLLAGAAMWVRPAGQPPGAAPNPAASGPPWPEAALGGGLGLLAGLVSIGGGIFLAPVLFLRRWAAARSIAAVTSLFICVNSLAGLAGRAAGGSGWPWGALGVLGLAVLAGGQLGTRATLRHLPPAAIRRTAAVLVLLVGARLLYRAVVAP